VGTCPYPLREAGDAISSRGFRRGRMGCVVSSCSTTRSPGRRTWRLAFGRRAGAHKPLFNHSHCLSLTAHPGLPRPAHSPPRRGVQAAASFESASTQPASSHINDTRLIGGIPPGAQLGGVPAGGARTRGRRRARGVSQLDHPRGSRVSDMARLRLESGGGRGA
jgi:hypothetical protein